jgi:hypothetical protein
VNAAWKNEEEMRMIREPENEILGTANQNWTVVYEENHTEIRPSCLDRVVKIIAVDYPEQAVEAIEPYRSLLQTVGLAATPEELFKIAHLLGTAGVTRITALGRMTSPEAAWHHDGRFNLLDLVQMVDIEYTAEAYAEKFASYVD